MVIFSGNRMMKLNGNFFIFFVVTLFLNLSSFAQDGTRNSNATDKGMVTNGKIMIIPFEPKLYMSEIDRKINQETNWNFEEIRENFRHQLDAELDLKLSKIAPVISFYSDSLKMIKDLNYIYKSSTLSYDLVDKSAGEAVNQKGIKNGQLAVEINTDHKFMNKKLTDPQLVSYLSKKYGASYFVFINELDIKNDMNSYDIASDTYMRNVAVHYSIIDAASKTMASGISNARFSSKINNPKKIVSQSFSQIGSDLSTILSQALMAK